MRRGWPLLAVGVLVACALAALASFGRPTPAHALSALQTAPTVTLSPTSGKVGATVSVSLAGYGASESVSIFWDSGTTAIKSVTTSTTGSVTTSFVVPTATKGAHTVTAKGNTSGRSDSATFTVVPSLTLTPTAGVGGTTVTVNLKGYAAGESVTLKWYNGTIATTLKTVTTATTGGVATTFVVPE